MNHQFLCLLIVLLTLSNCQMQKGHLVAGDASPTEAAPVQKDRSNPVPTLTASWHELPLHTWTQVAFAGQDVQYVTASVTEESPILYASLVNILYRSLDGGRTWQPITPPASCDETATQVMVHRVRPAEIYAFGVTGPYGMDCAYLGYSGDRGEKWETRPLPRYHVMGGKAWPTQLVMQNHPETGAWYRFWQGAWMGRASGQALARSTDRGQNWREVLLPPSGKVTVPIYDFHGFFKADSRWVLLVTHREGYYLSRTPGLGELYYGLEDGGWERIMLPGVLYQLVIAPDGRRTYLVLGTSPPTDNGELYRMTPDLKMEKVGPSPGCTVGCGWLETQSGQLFWVKQRVYETDQTETVSISVDGGKIWQQIPLPKPLDVYHLALQSGGDGNLTSLYLATNDGLWVYPYAGSLALPK